MQRLDHLNLSGITAEKLCTPFNRILGVSDEADPLEVKNKVREACTANIDSIVVFDQAHEFENYVLVKDLVAAGFRLEKDLLRKCNDLPQRSDLFEILDKFRRDCDRFRGHYPLYSVLSNKRLITGIINFADLNRRPVYIVAYAALVNSEIYLKTEIRRSYGRDDISWLDLLNSKERGKIHDIKKNNGVDYLDALSLKHLVSLVKNEKCKFRLVKHAELDSLEAVSNLRNRVAHPVRILIRKSRYKSDIKDLHRSVRILTVAGNEYFEKNR